MPVKMSEREYRALSLLTAESTAHKHFDTEHYVEGYALTYEPYVLFESDGVKIYEQVDKNAFIGADMTDIIMQYDHEGKVAARLSNDTLYVEPRDDGLFIAADLSSTEYSRSLYEDIAKGLVNKMSWAYSVEEEYFDRETRIRHIKRIKKVYDVSAVSIPANDATDIQARSFFNGVIEGEQRESRLRKQQQMKLTLQIELEEQQS